MAAAIGVSAKSSGTGTTRTTGGVTSQASGSTFLIGYAVNNASAPTSVTDSKSNTYTALGTAQQFDSGGGSRANWYYSQNGTGGASHTSSVAWSGSVTATTFFLELTGVLTSGVLETISNQIRDTASPFAVTTTGDTTQADGISIGFLGGDSGSNPATNNVSAQSYTIAVEETNGAANYTGCLAYKVLSATGSQTFSATETGAGNCAVFIAVFKASGGAPATHPPLSPRLPSPAIFTY